MCCSSLLTVSARAAAPLVFLGDSALPPYEFLDRDVPRGANVDLAMAVGRLLNRPTEVKLVDWSTASSRLLAGEGDVLTLLGRTPDREQQFVFGQGSMPVSFALFVRADVTERFETMNLKNQRIGVTAGGLAREELQARHPEATLIAVDGLVDGIQKVVRREIDAFAAQEWSTYYLLSELGIQGITGRPPFRSGTGGFAVRPGDEALAAQIDTAIAQLKTTGEFDRIIDRWSYTKVRLVQQSTMTAVSIAASVALAALVALSAALAVLHRRRRDLKREIVERSRAETALLLTQQQLQMEDKNKDQFLATLAHELRGPLAPIFNAINLLRSNTASAGQTDWAHQIIARQSGQLARLIDDLMDVSRIKTGRVELRLEPLDLSGLVALALESAEPVTAQGRHRVELRPATQTILVNGDRARLTQVLTNLLTNAAKYMAPGGAIVVETSVAGGYAEISISDTGAGIEVDFLEKVFEMFYQEGRSLKHSQGGLGVGLWLSRRLVLLHGGTLHAFSDGKGKGSRFVVRLPLADSPVLPSPKAPQAGASAGVRVLVVDDSADGAQTLAMLLELMGHQVMVAADGGQALANGAAFMPHAVVLDIGLPDIDGYEVCRRMRSSDWGRSALLIALTGWGAETDKQAAKNAGFDAHLTKPADAEELEQILRQVASADPLVAQSLPDKTF